MKTFDRYLFKNLLTATIFVSVTLAIVIFLTQSLRFLELVIEAGASGSAFWTLTMLALPRFFEIILPLSLMIAVIFTYNKMNNDSELVVIRAAGTSPLSIATPALFIALCVTCLLWTTTMWIAPNSLSAMQEKRQELKAQFSNLIFREGVFTQAGKGLIVYAREKAKDGSLHGLLIHDNRKGQKAPSTIMAKRGILSLTENGFQVMVYDGQRQEYDADKNILSRLNFSKYVIDIPDETTATTRWKQPDERTLMELLNPDLTIQRDIESKRDFRVEIHRRIISPILAITLTIMSCAALLIGPTDRRGQAKRILAAIIGAICVQGLYIAAYNIARQHDTGLLMMYLLAVAPVLGGLFLLSGFGDEWRRQWLYKKKVAA